MNISLNIFTINVFILLILKLTLAQSDIYSNNEARRNKIKEMTLHAWNSYKLHAWGKNELRPITKTSYDDGIFGKYSTGLTIVDSMDTLYLMNLTAEYEHGRNWIANSFCLDEVDQKINVFETNIRFVGGFLSLFALTGDALYKDKARYVADKLLPAFETPTGIPYRDVNFKTGEADGTSCLLSEYGTLSLEFVYLTYITGDGKYKKVIDRLYDYLKRKEKQINLFPHEINALTGEYGSDLYSIGDSSDSFYEYLLKRWIQSGKRDDTTQLLSISTMNDIMKYLIQKNPDGLTYMSSYQEGYWENLMEHLSCFSGGLFALAATTNISLNQSEHYMILAKEVTKTCHTLYNFTVTGLGPDSIYLLNSIKNDIASFASEYVLRPETVESYFYLWRTTHNPVYREWGWQVVKALEKHCRQPCGFAGISSVFVENTAKFFPCRDTQIFVSFIHR